MSTRFISQTTKLTGTGLLLGNAICILATLAFQFGTKAQIFGVDFEINDRFRERLPALPGFLLTTWTTFLATIGIILASRIRTMNLSEQEADIAWIDLCENGGLITSGISVRKQYSRIDDIFKLSGVSVTFWIPLNIVLGLIVVNNFVVLLFVELKFPNVLFAMQSVWTYVFFVYCWKFPIRLLFRYTSLERSV